MQLHDFREWLEERLDRIEGRVDKLADSQAEANVTLAKNAADIEHHIKRTDMLEKWLEVVATDVHPIKEHVAKLKGVMWFVGAVGAVITFVIGVWKALDS